MKKCILSTIGGAAAMLIALIVIANISAAGKQEKEEYEHIDFVSTITQENCCVCGNVAFPFSSHWSEDNVGIVNLKGFIPTPAKSVFYCVTQSKLHQRKDGARWLFDSCRVPSLFFFKEIKCNIIGSYISSFF